MSEYAFRSNQLPKNKWHPCCCFGRVGVLFFEKSQKGQKKIEKIKLKLKMKKMRWSLKENLDEDWNKFISDFARAVTVQSSGEDSWLAKNGDESIFSVFKNLCPQV